MRRIGETFQRLRLRGEGALIGFAMGGDPTPEVSERIALTLARGGVDILELGIPFSDPVADGPVIQASSIRALEAGTTPSKVLDIARVVRKDSNLPIVLLTYFNPVYQIGLEEFADMSRKAGVDGLVIPDLPVEEATEYKCIMENHEIDTVFLAAPSTSVHRLERIVQSTSGFLYLVSLYGVTGVREKLEESTVQLVRRFAATLAGRVPLAVGFGISKREHIESLVNSGADGAIVGSAFIRTIQECQHEPTEALRRLEAQASELKAGTRKS